MSFNIDESKVSPKTFLSFIEEVSKLSEVEFVGLSKILCVPILDKDKDENERPFEEILSDMMDKFLMVKRGKRKEILKMIKDVNRAKSLD